MALEKEFFMLLKGNLESLQQTGDDFVWVHQKDLNINHDISIRQEERYERAPKCLDVTTQTNKNQDCIMSNFIEDEHFSHDEYWDQFEHIVEKVSRDRKFTKQGYGHRRVISSKRINNNKSEDVELIHPALKTFDSVTTGILKSIVTPNNYYRGLFGNFISKGSKSVVIYARIHLKTYPLWHPGVKLDFYKFHGKWKMWRSEQNAVKVYKLSANSVYNEKIFEQVQNEKKHLRLLHTAKCNVPEVKHASRNVIIMSFVGEDGIPAPSISTLPSLSPETYHLIVNDMDMWYKNLHMVNGKLSPRNILYWNNKLHYIGWSHSVKTDHPLALKKLMRDCLFITKFFEARLAPVKSAERLFKDITGLQDIDNYVPSTVHSKDLWKNQHLANPNRTPFRHKHSPAGSCRFK